MVATVVYSGAIGIYSLGTLPAFRNRGYGEALLGRRCARVRRACRWCLNPLRQAIQLYRRLGFREVGKFTVYLTK